jgi:hypothetical protein
MTDDDTIDLTFEKYERLRDGFLQNNAEGWFPVIRLDDEPVEARPVERQDDIYEGERTESDQWIIREDTGETYTVSDEVFEDRYEEQGSLRTERFAVDLSWDGEVEDDELEDDIEIDGWDLVAEVAALIDVRTQTVKSLNMVNVSLGQDNWQDMDGIPLELLYDSPMFNRMEDVESQEDDE